MHVWALSSLTQASCKQTDKYLQISVARIGRRSAEKCHTVDKLHHSQPGFPLEIPLLPLPLLQLLGHSYSPGAIQRKEVSYPC